MNRVDIDVVFERVRLLHKHAGADTEIQFLPWDGHTFEIERTLNEETTRLWVMVQERHIRWVWWDTFNNAMTKGIYWAETNLESVVVEICINFACGYSHTTHKPPELRK